MPQHVTQQTTDLDEARTKVRAAYLESESDVLEMLVTRTGFTADYLAEIEQQAVEMVEAVRASGRKSLMESFMVEYSLSSEEGVALMCLAEALLRVPDKHTISALIEDKISPHEWRTHLGQADSALVNASTWGLLLSSTVLKGSEAHIQNALRTMVRRLGEPVIRSAVAQAMKQLGRQFVLGQDMREAMAEGEVWQKKGYTYSFDMLGEAARTEEDAERYLQAYADAIARIASACTADRVADNPGISIKLSALYSRYEALQKDQVMQVLVPRVQGLARAARAAQMGFNIDAEEADRLDISLDVIEAVLQDPALEGWDGFGVVVQAYGKRASCVLDWLYALAVQLDRKIMVRLVKGAYWDTEIKRAQVIGLPDFPVFTRKAATDISWIACAHKLLTTMQDRIYPQFATHNAHSMAAILQMVSDRKDACFEFQRLHGMGEVLHDQAITRFGAPCRIYAPVGSHEDLLAYLVRRLLENGANSSFVNKIGDARVPSAMLAADPFRQLARLLAVPTHRGIDLPQSLYGPKRQNAMGWDVTDSLMVQTLQEQSQSWLQHHKWRAHATLWDGRIEGERHVLNPANSADVVGVVYEATAEDAQMSLHVAQSCQGLAKSRRIVALETAADLLEQHHAELFVLLAREAGKSILDAIAEVREAVDFLRYYAQQADLRPNTEEPCGIVVCISPWNFPLAIFLGQVSAALVMGNRVIAKPAEQTPLIAARAVALLHEAGIPKDMLQLVPGDGALVGQALVQNACVNAVCFTGSTETARIINQAMAAYVSPEAPLIAETGGLNAMIVDSTALPEQAVRDIIQSGFASAGQRCSALRMLYLQEDVADKILGMICGAMDMLRLGNPCVYDVDVGPVIDAGEQSAIQAYIDQKNQHGQVIKQVAAPEKGSFVGPALIRVTGIAELEREVFGPVVHVATFKAVEYDQILADINAKGYGLTFGVHSRLDSRIASTCQQIRVGNVYVNRNQIGAVVGSQPFGGEGLSGTGPKAGGPDYLSMFTKPSYVPQSEPLSSTLVFADTLQQAIDLLAAPEQTRGHQQEMPGPTGEFNQLSQWSRGVWLVLGQQVDLVKPFMDQLKATGNRVVLVGEGVSKQSAYESYAHDGTALLLDGAVFAKDLADLTSLAGVVSTLPVEMNMVIRKVLADRPGPILPLVLSLSHQARFVFERHVSIDTTATGGNASLLMAEE